MCFPDDDPGGPIVDNVDNDDNVENVDDVDM